MKHYIVTATDKHGIRDTFGREAASVEHARTALEQAGYTGIEFVDDESLAYLREQRSPELKPKTQAEFRFEAKLRKGRDLKVIWLEAMRRNWWVLLLLGASVAYGIYQGFSSWFWSGLLGTMVFILEVAIKSRAGGTYDELIKATARGHLQQAEALLAKMQSYAMSKKNEQVRVDLIFRKASLCARRGRVEEGLAFVEPLRDNTQITKGMFESRTASIYYAAGRIADFVAWQEKAYEASGHAALQKVDFAFVLARFGDIGRARELLNEIDVRNLIPSHKAVFQAAQGICFMRERGVTEASRNLTEAVATLAPYANAAPTWPFQGIIVGYAAIALARDGRRDEARALLDPWKEVALNCIDPSARRMVESEVLG